MPELYAGLISGTSMDGIDAVVADFAASPPRILAAETTKFSPRLCGALDELRADPQALPARRLARLDAMLGDAFAEAALSVIRRAGLSPKDVRAIGSHGQTVLHDPDHQPPTTLQIGDPHRIATRTGIVTIADFRRADLAAGGQGAPLAPLLHRILLASAKENRAVINLGGIANISLLPADGGVRGFDTGPANCFMDCWYRAHHAARFDSAGTWAATGNVDADWLERLLDEPYFLRRPPKSTGIEYFSPDWLQTRLPDWANDRPADVQATLLELSVQSLALGLNELPAKARPARIIACGGGVHNQTLMHRLSECFRPAEVVSSAVFGLNPDHVEALLFAWLGRERLAQRPVNTAPVTGAATPILAGTVFAPPPAGLGTPGLDHSPSN